MQLTWPKRRWSIPRCVTKRRRPVSYGKRPLNCDGRQYGHRHGDHRGGQPQLGARVHEAHRRRNPLARRPRSCWRRAPRCDGAAPVAGAEGSHRAEPAPGAPRPRRTARRAARPRLRRDARRGWRERDNPRGGPARPAHRRTAPPGGRRGGRGDRAAQPLPPAGRVPSGADEGGAGPGRLGEPGAKGGSHGGRAGRWTGPAR